MRKLLCALGLCVAGAAQAAPAYSTLSWSGFTSTMAAGTVSDSRGHKSDPSGVRDFLSIASQSDATVFTLNLSREVVNPVFHADDVDFRNYSFQDGVTVTVPSALNLVAAGGHVSDVKRLDMAIAPSGAATEPGGLALAGLGLVLAGTAGRRAYRPRLKPTDSTLGLRMSSSRGEGRVTLAS